MRNKHELYSRLNLRANQIDVVRNRQKNFHSRHIAICREYSYMRDAEVLKWVIGERDCLPLAKSEKEAQPSPFDENEDSSSVPEVRDKDEVEEQLVRRETMVEKLVEHNGDVFSMPDKRKGIFYMYNRDVETLKWVLKKRGSLPQTPL